MPNYVLSTCGTSLITNRDKDKYRVEDKLRKSINQYTNCSNWDEIPADDASLLKKHIQQRKAALLQANEEEVCRLSAELNGLIHWRNQYQKHVPKQDVYALLATDTLFGRETARMIKEWLSKQDIAVSVEIISKKGLKTSSFIDFREALSELSKHLVEVLEGYKKNAYEIYFNLTGGFKSLNGFLQAISIIYADKAFYLFEGSSELLFIPKLPFQFNTQDIINEHLVVFRRLGNNLSISDDAKHAFPDIFLLSVGDSSMLSEWGELLWQSSYDALYREKLLPSISERVQFTDGFEKSCEGLNGELLKIVNEQIAQLAYYCEHDCKKPLKSLDVKALQNQTFKKQNLYECDLDGNHRIFMVKQEDHCFQLEKVGKALH